jgi:amino acid adenylation domain-containing protein
MSTVADRGFSYDDEVSSGLVSLASALELLAGRQPGVPAVQAPGRPALTYADLAAQIRDVRQCLGGLGIRPGDVVAGVIRSRAEMAVACASLPSSSTFLPLGESVGVEVCEDLLARLRPRAVVVPGDMDHAIRRASARAGVAELDLVADPEAPAGRFTLRMRHARASLDRGAGAARPDMAIVLVSSGATGRPKLVPLSNDHVLRYAAVTADWLGYAPGDVSCHLGPMHLANGVKSGVLNPLLAGATILCLPDPDIARLFAAIEEYRPTSLNGGFTFHRAILRQAPEHRGALAHARFRFVRATTGRLEADEIDGLEQVLAAPVVISYSSSEAPIAHTPLPPGRRKHGTVGLPFGGEVGIRDDAGRFVAPGERGEIVVRGPLVFDGYLDDPELTAAAFDGEWYRTGDEGHLDDDGYVCLTGRLNDVINRGGEKISPLAVDAAIESLPGVAEAAAFGIPHPSLGQEIVAAVVRQPGAAVEGGQIIAHVGARIGPAQAPRRIYFVDRLPRTDNDKVRRRELAQIVSARSREAVSPPGPSPSPVEEIVLELWRTVLPGCAIGRDDDFFLLGGDSLRGMQLLARLKALFGIDFPIASLFGEAATVSGMARAVEAMCAGESRPSGPMAAPPRMGEPAPLSHGQRRLWFLAQLQPDQTAYNESVVYHLTGPLDVEALRASLHAVLRRHDILRTRFVLVDGEPCQVVHEKVADPELIDLSSLPASEQEDALASALARTAQEPFDLAVGPLIRVTVVRLRANEHVLVRTWHHIVSDARSQVLFEEDLSTAYDALVTGRAPALPPLPVQYANHAVRQTGEGADAARGPGLAYWTAQLRNLVPLPLPTDHPRPAVLSHRGATLVTWIPSEVVEVVKGIGRARGATPFMVFLAAFQVFLHRYTGAEDVAVGTPISGRSEQDLQELIGFFVNTLVLRADLSGEPSFPEVVDRVRDMAVAAYAHGDVPFEKLVEVLAPARDTSRSPLVQVVLALHTMPETAVVFPGIAARRMPWSRIEAKFDLYLSLRETAAGMRLTWEYRADLFEAATIERMAGHLRALFESIAAEPTRPIGRLALLPSDERERLRRRANVPGYRTDATVDRLVEAQAERTPDALAVVDAAGAMSYAELDARADALAHRLGARGVAPGALVGLCMERSAELIVAMLGILKAGAAYVPLDPERPHEHLRFVLDDTAATTVLTVERLSSRLPEFAGRTVCLDREWPALATSPGPPARRPVGSPRDVACVLYTSGSTGRPKGVPIRHESIVRLVCQTNYVSLSAQDVVAQSSNPAFDASLIDIWGPLLNGARIVVLTREELLSPPALAGALAARGVSCLFLATALFHQVAAERPDAFRGLQYLLFGGEVCDPARVRALLRHGPPRHLVNLYGPTEATTLATFHEVRAVEDGRSVPIGTPVAGTEVMLLDRHGEVVPDGVVGEIHIGGIGVATGYLGRPEETAARFVPHPWRGDAERVYRTGDLARRLGDGSLEFVGRDDDQVKIRGFRVEPSEIRAVLNGHRGVRASHVVVHEAGPGDRELTAYVVPADGDAPAAAELRRFLASRLPAHMVPVAFIPVASIPLTPNGKVDHRALPDPATDRHHRAFQDYAAPRDDAEEVLCRVWAEVLGVERVGIDDDFFSLGGHSLLAARLFARLEEALGAAPPLATLFVAPTIRGLADACRSLLAPRAGTALVALREAGSLPALYAVPWVHGNVLCFVPLARALGGEQPFYGLQSPGLDGAEPPLSSIEAMATRYVSEIRAHRPRGPYALLGVCFGATVAWEMARQLVAAGEQVAFLGLLDPTRREGGTPAARPVSPPSVLAGSTGAEWEIRQLQVHQANLEALDGHRRRPLGTGVSAVEVFETAGVADRRAIAFPWDGDVVRHLVPGLDSEGMLREHAGALATLLAARLAVAQASAGGEGLGG